MSAMTFAARGPLASLDAAARRALFDRNTTTGALSQKPIPNGCISLTSNGDRCVDGEAINGAQSVTVSPDGKSELCRGVDFVGTVDVHRQLADGIGLKHRYPQCLETGGGSLRAGHRTGDAVLH